MPWCPKCKYEYVAGKTFCPDCKVNLVDELPSEIEIIDEEPIDEINQYSDAQIPTTMDEAIEMLRSRGLSEVEIEETIKNFAEQAEERKVKYINVEEQYGEHSSAVGTLIVIGVLGIIVLILNEINLLNLPFSGSSKYIVDIVMGTLFVFFIVGGISSLKKAKLLKPQIQLEKENIDLVINYLKECAKNDEFKIINNELSEEEKSLFISQKAVALVQTKFPDLPDGFAYYVTDRYYQEIFEDEN